MHGVKAESLSTGRVLRGRLLNEPTRGQGTAAKKEAEICPQKSNEGTASVGLRRLPADDRRKVVKQLKVSPLRMFPVGISTLALEQIHKHYMAHATIRPSPASLSGSMFYFYRN